MGDRSIGVSSFLSLSDSLVWAVVLLTLGYMGYAAAVIGPTARTAAEQQWMTEIAEENEAFCSLFGIGLGTSRYSACATELMNMRAKHERRLAAQTATNF
jgi:hypothetical protein